MLHVQTLPCKMLITTGCGMSTSEIQHSILEICYNYALEVWYGPEEFCTLNPESGRHFSLSDIMWLVARPLSDEALHIAITLADGA